MDIPKQTIWMVQFFRTSALSALTTVKPAQDLLIYVYLAFKTILLLENYVYQAKIQSIVH